MKEEPAITWRRTIPECEPGTDGIAASSELEKVEAAEARDHERHSNQSHQVERAQEHASCGRSVAALYNAVRPHAAVGYKAPAHEVFVPALAAWPAPQPRPAPPAMLPVAPRPTLN